MTNEQLDATLSALSADAQRDQGALIAAFAKSKAVANLVPGARVVPLDYALAVAAAMGYLIAKNEMQANELEALVGTKE